MPVAIAMIAFSTVSQLSSGNLMPRLSIWLSIAALLLAGPLSAQDAAPAPEPRNTPGLPAHLQPVDDMLAGGLINDPTDINWAYYGLGRSLVVDESYPGGGAALRIAMGRAGHVYAGGVNIPLLAPIQDGDVVTVGFYARTIESHADNGMGQVRVRFQRNREPYPGFGDTVVEVGPEWEWYEVSARADQSIRREGIVALQFGLARQTVEVGQAIVVTGAPTILP